MLISLRNGMLAGGEEPKVDAVCFENVGSTTGTVCYKKTRNIAPDLDLVYSYDGKSWSTFNNNVSVEVPSRKRCYVRAGEIGQTSLGSTSDSNHFELKGSQFKASGKLMYLLNKTGDSQLGPCTFSEAFICCENLVDASKLEMPSTVSANYQFNSMFNGCTYLTAAPAELPALSATGQNTHAWMFAYCSYLTAAPAFRAQSFKSSYGCDYMFYNCYSLVNVPDLSATELTNMCYRDMFYNCTALKDAPALPAVNPAPQSYYQMFQNCNSLSSITVSFTSWGTATQQWTSNVQSTGIFKCPAALGTNETITRGNSNCPTGWTVVNT